MKRAAPSHEQNEDLSVRRGFSHHASDNESGRLSPGSAFFTGAAASFSTLSASRDGGIGGGDGGCFAACLESNASEDDLERSSGIGCLPLSSRDTTTKGDKDELDTLIVKELNSLSLQEREMLFEEIHGVVSPLEESDELLNQKLKGMQTALGWLKKKSAYDQAKFINPAFVYDRELRLAILRASHYDETQAARRLIQHFQFKLELFGVDKLTSNITQDDLTPGMQKCLRSGLYQVSPKKDRAGRVVHFAKSSKEPDANWRDHFGMLWYISTMAMVSDVEAQKKGFVSIVSFISSPTMEIDQRAAKTKAFMSAAAGRSSAIFFLYDDPRLRPVFSLLHLSMANKTRLRVRSYHGSYMECMYQLAGYGITPDMLPIDTNGNLDLLGWNRRLDEAQEKERSTRIKESGLVVPQSRDCVIGRGYPFQKFPGNVYLSCVVHYNQTAYSNAKRSQKNAMLDEILNFIRNVRGGRFLKRIPDESKTFLPPDERMAWVVASDEESLMKIGHVFRTKGRSDIYHLGQLVTRSLPCGVDVLLPESPHDQEWF